MHLKTEKTLIKKKQTTTKIIRYIILIASLLFVAYKGYMHQVLGGGSDGSPSIHALCPYGALESFYLLFAQGIFIEKIFSGTMVLLLITIILSIIFKRSFCGLICPFGALQEFMSILGQKIFKKKFIMPDKIDKLLRYLKYFILLITAVFAWKTGELWMSSYDPWSAYAHMFGEFEEVIDENLIGFIILIITLVGSILYDRFFCKYLCPMGAFLGIISKISPNKIVKNKSKCINCKICSKKCPANINIAELKEINSAECLNCQTCTLLCPIPGALENKQLKKTMTPIVLIISVITIYFGGITVAKATNNYDLLPEPIEKGEIVNAEDIKGYMTLEEVSDYTGISLEELYEKLNLSKNIPSNIKMKSIKEYKPNFEVNQVRELLLEK
ncbi:4Fe-4S binding protein [Tepidibacter aestuarii]|uniref:4Fe-4S binding protein n=1 Tax=Tepidibacter aestuarii TaxID=2925782 RepID=UPI0020BFF9B8|nr:4Fe-4S binding protein [Tepidibacter aestuarii]CAH2212804.1 NosR/NirI family transcriptional regulator, nitrous oxide reductase regulator [Tepidibacter aestuarii]